MKSILLLLLLCVGWSAASEIIAPSMPEQEVQLMLRMGVDEYYLEQRGWIVDKIKNVIASIKERFQIFRSWMENQMREVLEMSKPHAEIMKDMALLFIKEMSRMVIEAVIEAGYQFFREQQSEIGEEIWRVIEALYRRYLEGKLSYSSLEIADFSVDDFDRYALAGCDTEYLLTEAFFIDTIKNVINAIREQLRPFKSWISNIMSDMMEIAQPHVKTIQQMALIFVKEMTKSVINSVIEAGYLYFQERQNELGIAIWELVDQLYRKYLEGKLQYLQ